MATERRGRYSSEKADCTPGWPARLLLAGPSAVLSLVIFAHLCG